MRLKTFHLPRGYTISFAYVTTGRQWGVFPIYHDGNWLAIWLWCFAITFSDSPYAWDDWYRERVQARKRT